MKYHVHGYVAYQILVPVDYEIEAEDTVEAKNDATYQAAHSVPCDAQYQFDSLLCELVVEL